MHQNLICIFSNFLWQFANLMQYEEKYSYCITFSFYKPLKILIIYIIPDHWLTTAVLKWMFVKLSEAIHEYDHTPLSFDKWFRYLRNIEKTQLIMQFEILNQLEVILFPFRIHKSNNKSSVNATKRLFLWINCCDSFRSRGG